jgi:hypothetical protein
MDKVTGAIDQFLPPELAKQVMAPFEPCAKYYATMDYLLYLEKDTAYRADRVDSYLTLLWHPDEDQAVGVKLKGFRYLFERMKEILGTRNIEISDDEFLPLVTALEIAMTAGDGPRLLAEAQQARLKEKYEKARTLVRSVQFDPRELKLAA